MPEGCVPEVYPRDPDTGLPGAGQALVDLTAALGRARQERYSRHGLLIVAVKPNAAILRLSAERAATLKREISWQLAGLLRPQDQLYILSSWEWMILLPTLLSPAVLPLAMVKIQRSFTQAMPTPERPDFQLVCGGVLYPEDGDDAQHLIQSARIAVLNAGPGNDWSLRYRPEMEQQSALRAQLIRQLQEALQQDQLQLFVQPQVNLSDQRCEQAETLLRWKPPGLEGWMDPILLVEALEEGGLRTHFNRWLFQRAAWSLARLEALGMPIRLSVNLTGHDLLDPEVPDLILQSLALWQVDPRRLTLEITETAAVQESLEVETVLQRLHDRHIRLAIDDFGTGYANMAYLQRMPVQEIKVDKRFIQEDVPRDRAITRSIAELAHKLGMEVVVEGVESADSLPFLRDLACERVQGFLFSPALDLEGFCAWMQKRRDDTPG